MVGVTEMNAVDWRRWRQMVQPVEVAAKIRIGVSLELNIHLKVNIDV